MVLIYILLMTNDVQVSFQVFTGTCCFSIILFGEMSIYSLVSILIKLAVLFFFFWCHILGMFCQIQGHED